MLLLATASDATTGDDGSGVAQSDRADAPRPERSAPGSTAYRVQVHTSPWLDAAAQRCLDDLEALAVDYRREVRELPGYLSGTVGDEELDHTAQQVLELMLRHLCGDPVAETLAARSAAVGRRRAQQGLPLDSLLRAVRMDFRFLWGHLSGSHPQPSADLTGEVLTLWDTVEFHSNHVQAAYTDELMRLRRESELEREYLLRQLLVTGIDDDRQRESTAERLGVEGSSDLLLLVGHPGHGRLFRDGLEALDGSLVVHAIDGLELAIVPAGRLDRLGWRRLHELPAGVTPRAAGLAELAQLWPVARRLALLACPGRAAMVDDHWPMLLGDDLEPAVRALGAARLHALGSVPLPSRESLLRTMRHYLDSGSVARTATELHCHRNTILKRLQRFRSLTGLDATVPSQAALAHLLLVRADADVVPPAAPAG